MGRITSAIQNLSIRKSFMLYMLMFLVLAAALSSISINYASDVENQIHLSYAENQSSLDSNKGKLVIVLPPVEYKPGDKAIIDICNFVKTWSIPLFFGLCIVLAAMLFYRNKLKKPIELLDQASEKITMNDLDFHLSYASKDEMGRLCVSFETMREALEKNNRNLWRSIEERKRLNAAFSHDLRTPLTVLRGYSDFLIRYFPQGKISEEKLISTVSMMSEHISRLEDYVRMMSEVQKLEDTEMNLTDVEGVHFLEQLQSTAVWLAQNSGRKLSFVNELPESILRMDLSIVMRVFENLITNAARYAKEIISVRCGHSGGILSITVSDDGNGFSDKDLKQATKPYYKKDTETDTPHFGLGLHISKLLCEKHGGNLRLGNGENGGATVMASFLCDKK